MIRTLLILLFAMTSSSALAETNSQVTRVPGPCLVNQINNNGYFIFNVFNGFGQLIATYSDYRVAMDAAVYQERIGACRGIQTNSQLPPTPPPPQSFCQIFQARDAYGNSFFRVVDRFGRILYQTFNYFDATQVAMHDMRCYQ